MGLLTSSHQNADSAYWRSTSLLNSQRTYVTSITQAIQKLRVWKDEPGKCFNTGIGSAYKSHGRSSLSFLFVQVPRLLSFVWSCYLVCMITMENHHLIGVWASKDICCGIIISFRSKCVHHDQIIIRVQVLERRGNANIPPRHRTRHRRGVHF